MWTQVYSPVAGSIALSALVAALPLVVLAYLLVVRRTLAARAALASLAVAALVALLVYGAPATVVVSAALMGAAFGLFPIMWIVLNALFIYNLTVVTGRFEVIRDSVAAISHDRRVQALLVAFSFGALIESIAGFGTPIALAGPMLVGLGFAAPEALLLTLLANTTAVAFGNMGIPVISLAGVIAPLLGVPRGELEAVLSTAVARQVSLLSIAIPSLLVLVVAGWRGLREVWPAALTAGVSFGLTQLVVATLFGPSLAGIAASLASFGALLVLLRVWQPLHPWQTAYWSEVAEAMEEVMVPEAEGETAPEAVASPPLSRAAVVDAWSPFLVLVAVVTVGSLPAVGAALDSPTLRIAWPGLDGEVLKVPPLVPPELAGTPSALYPAVFVFDWLHAAGTLVLLAGLIVVALLRVSPAEALRVYWHTLLHLRRSILAVVGFLALAWVMNYAGLTATLGLFLTFTGALFPFFSALIGWLGVFLTGSDTSSNNLFGGLQVAAGQEVGVSPVLMAATNSTGGVCGKLVSPQNLAIGTAAVGLQGAEGRLLRRTAPLSLGLACVVGILALIQAYLLPGTVP